MGDPNVPPIWPRIRAERARRELTIRCSRNATREDFDHVMASIRAGHVPTDRIATHATSFDDVPVNLPLWAKARQGLIKAIISV